MQAVELERYLKRLLDRYQVAFQKYDHARLLELLPRNIHKGAAVMRIFDNVVSEMAEANLDTSEMFILCVGNDRSDEKMFEAIELAKEDLGTEDIFTATIGLKHTTARFYLVLQSEMNWLLNTLCNANGLLTGSLTNADLINNINNSDADIGDDEEKNEYSQIDALQMSYPQIEYNLKVLLRQHRHRLKKKAKNKAKKKVKVKKTNNSTTSATVIAKKKKKTNKQKDDESSVTSKLEIDLDLDLVFVLQFGYFW
jgi:hypothetical protein